MNTYKEIAELSFGKLSAKEQIEFLSDKVNDFSADTIFGKIIDQADLDDYIRDNIDDFINEFKR